VPRAIGIITEECCAAALIRWRAIAEDQFELAQHQGHEAYLGQGDRDGLYIPRLRA